MKIRLQDAAEYTETKPYCSKSGAIHPFGLMLQRVSQEMNLEQCKRVATMIRLQNAQFDLIHSSADLLRIMEQRNEVSEHHVSYLRSLVTEIKLPKAVKIIQQYEDVYCFGSKFAPSHFTYYFCGIFKIKLS